MSKINLKNLKNILFKYILNKKYYKK